MTTNDPIIRAYDTRAADFAETYESVSFESVHGDWLHLIGSVSDGPRRSALDVGAGSGRDAAWLARRDFDVTAVEPATGLRRIAAGRHAGLPIRWLDDTLPELRNVRSSGGVFDLILLSAVWMHVTPVDRPAALATLSALCKRGGLVVITLRHGPPPPDRPMHPVSAEELVALASERGLALQHHSRNTDGLRREEVHWETVVLKP